MTCMAICYIVLRIVFIFYKESKQKNENKNEFEKRQPYLRNCVFDRRF